MPSENPVNFSDHNNVLSIIIELDVEELMPGHKGLVGVVVETARRPL